MAISATEIFERHPECYDAETAELFRAGRDPFHLPGLHFTRETAASIAINHIGGGAVIMAGSGMCTGGRIRHHLQNNISRQECSILFVGYAATGTLARHVIDGAKEVRIYGEKIPVRAKFIPSTVFRHMPIRLNCSRGTARPAIPNVLFLVHGEEEVMRQFATHLKGTEVVMPALNESFTI